MTIEKLSHVYRAHGFGFYYCDTKEDALALVKALIPKGSSASIGGSVTLQQCGIQNWLETWFAGKYYDRYSQDETEVFKAALGCDVYLSSCNALDHDGSLYFMDGRGNRVAAISYGPKQVIIIAGINKLVADENQARLRIQTIAAPQNAARLGRECPCVNGQCLYQNDCLCQKYLRVSNGDNQRIKLVLVNEELGY